MLNSHKNHQVLVHFRIESSFSARWTSGCLGNDLRSSPFFFPPLCPPTLLDFCLECQKGSEGIPCGCWWWMLHTPWDWRVLQGDLFWGLFSGSLVSVAPVKTPESCQQALLSSCPSTSPFPMDFLRFAPLHQLGLSVVIPETSKRDQDPFHTGHWLPPLPWFPKNPRSMGSASQVEGKQVAAQPSPAASPYASSPSPAAPGTPFCL